MDAISTDKMAIAKLIKLKGLELGYTKVGITTADDFEEYLQELMSRPAYTPWINTKEGLKCTPMKGLQRQNYIVPLRGGEQVESPGEDVNTIDIVKISHFHILLKRL